MTLINYAPNKNGAYTNLYQIGRGYKGHLFKKDMALYTVDIIGLGVTKQK